MSIKRRWGKLYISKRLPDGEYCKDMVQCRCDCGRTMDVSYTSIKAGIHTQCLMCGVLERMAKEKQDLQDYKNRWK